MSSFFKDLIMKKIANLSPKELLSYGKQYGFSLTESQAQAITTYLKTHRVDPFSANGRTKMLQELARITDLETAKKAQKLFNEIIKSYGLESLFY